jgi:hypothetical protein
MSITYSIELWLLKFGFMTVFWPLGYQYSRMLRTYMYFVSLIIGASILALLIIPWTSCSPIQKNWYDPRSIRVIYPDAIPGVLVRKAKNHACGWRLSSA